VVLRKGVVGCVGGSGVCRKASPIPFHTPFLIPSGKCYLSYLPQIQCLEKREGWKRAVSSLSDQYKVGTPAVWSRAATSRLMSQHTSSQILSLFSFLLHEMGIINEKQRGKEKGRKEEGESHLPV
jgi:hypothetical protein